jgi:hypothetical protein
MDAAATASSAAAPTSSLAADTASPSIIRPVLTAGVSSADSPAIQSATPPVLQQTGSIVLGAPVATSSRVDAMHPTIRLAPPSLADLDAIEGPPPTSDAAQLQARHAAADY